MPDAAPSDNTTSVDWDATTYDAISSPQARWGADVVTRLELSGNECVLDAGCGSGRVTELLVERLPQGKVIALDSSATMIASARDRLARFDDRVVFVEIDLLELTPERIGAFAPVDAIFSNAALHWVRDHDRLFHNLAGVLRPGGQLIAQCGGKGNLTALWEAIGRLSSEHHETRVYASAEATHRRLVEAGFTQISTWLTEEPTTFPSRQALEQFLATVCLREHVVGMSEEQRVAFVAKTAELLPGGIIDFVRLNIAARKS